MSMKMTRGKSYVKRLQVHFQWSSRNGIIGWLARQITGKTRFRCLVCLVAGGSSEFEVKHEFTNEIFNLKVKRFLPCTTAGCKAQFCIDCLPFLNNKCSRCRLSIVRVSDIEEDVSDDEGDHATTGILRYVS